MVNSKKEIPYVYIYVYHKIKKKYNKKIYLKPKEILMVLKQICRVPKVLHYPILSQMENHKLIKRINHQKYRVLKSDCEKIIEKLRCLDFWK